MTVAQLHTFLTVCESMSFTQAARQQYISQPAVSRQIASLEAELGAELFDRSHSGIRLTSAGQHLARHLGPVLDHLDALLNQVHEIGNGQSGSLTIGLLLDQSIDQRVSRALRWFRQSHNIRITIYRYAFMELVNSLKSGAIDLAISIESTETMFSGCERLIYAREYMCFAARRDLLMRTGDRIDENSIRMFTESFPVLMPKLDTFPEADRRQLAANPHDDVLSPAEIEYDLASIAPMVAAGLAATVVNESHMLTTDQSIALYPYENLPRIDKGIFWKSDSANPLVPLFCDCLRSLVSGGGPVPEL